MSKIIKPFEEQGNFYRVCRHESGRKIVLNEGGMVYSIEQIRALKDDIEECLSQWTTEELNVAQAEHEQRENDYQEWLENRGHAAQAKPGHVYLLRFQDGLYKIGRAKNLAERMGNYRSHSTNPPNLICSIATSNPAGMERELHELFAAKRVEGREWFRLADEDVRYIVRFAETGEI